VSTTDIATGRLPTIEQLDVIEVCVPRTQRNRIRTTYGTLPDAHFALVHIQAEGLEGAGEASTDHWWTGEDAVTVRHVIETYLAPLVKGERLGIRDAAERMKKAIEGHPHARAAIETALWDVLGKAVGLPLHALLGRADARPLRIKYVIGLVEPEYARQEAEYAHDRGINYLKIKVGGDLEDDLRRVEAVADVLGGRGNLGVDAQSGWSFATTISALAPLEALGVAFLEQPVARDYPEQMAEITRRSTIPIVAHESLFSLRDAMEAAHHGIGHIWALTPQTHGGVTPTLELLSVARASGRSCLLGSTVELGVGTALVAQLGVAFDEFSDCPVPSDVIGPLYHEDDVVVEQPQIIDGYVHVPPGPGLGVSLDWERIKRYRVK